MTQLWLIFTFFRTLYTQAATKHLLNASGTALYARARCKCTQQICSTLQMCCLVCVSSPTHLKPRQAATAACISSVQVCEKGGGGPCAHINIYPHIHNLHSYDRACADSRLSPYTVCSPLSVLHCEIFHWNVVLSKALHSQILMLMRSC